MKKIIIRFRDSKGVFQSEKGLDSLSDPLFFLPKGSLIKTLSGHPEELEEKTVNINWSGASENVDGEFLLIYYVRFSWEHHTTL